MVRFLRLIALVAVLLLPGASSSVSHAIVGGVPDTAHPNVGAMVLNYPGRGIVQGCTGTLIHPRVVVTAAHCINETQKLGVTAREVWVNFDQHALNLGTLRTVDQMIMHPQFNWGPYANPYDVGVLILTEPVTTLTPARLPTPGFLNELAQTGQLRSGSQGARFTVVGYGNTEPIPFAGDASRRVAQSEFLNLQPAWLMMSQNSHTGNGGTCYNDSGGPGFWTTAAGEEILVGVTSWGDRQCRATGFDYRLDLPESLDFLADVISALD